MREKLNIPKTIHYCWFGGKPLPDEYKSYIDSWKKFCPDFKIKEWNENNFIPQINSWGGYNSYFEEAYEAKQWAFVSDYARLKIVYEEGGIYLDTDVEVLKSLEPLISNGEGFIGFQNSYEATTGLGFAAAPFNPVVKAMLDIYAGRHFLCNDGKYDRIPCPAANTVALINCGMKIGKKYCQELQKLEGITVYPEEYFNPLNRDTNHLTITKNTYTIHHYSGTWFDARSKKKALLKKIIPNWFLKKRVELIAQKDIKKIVEEIKSN